MLDPHTRGLFKIAEVHLELDARLGGLRHGVLSCEALRLLSLGLLDDGGLHSLPHVRVAAENFLAGINSQ